MENIVDRIYKVIDYAAINVSEFSKKIQVSNGYFAKQRANKANIGSHIIEKIVRYFPEINSLWLITGEGSMILERRKKIPSIEGAVNSNDNNNNNFYRSYTKITRLLDIYDKDNISFVYENMSYFCEMMHMYIEHYSLFNKIECFIDKNDKSEIQQKLCEFLTVEKEVLKIILPHKDSISDIYNKLKDFDFNNDKEFYIDLDLDGLISDTLKDEIDINNEVVNKLSQD